MIQKELDLLEQQVLTDIFGGYSPENFIISYGIFRYDLTPKVQKVITEFENIVKPFMNADGFINGSELKKIISVPYLQIPNSLFRPIDIYREIQPLIIKLKGYILG